MLYFAYGSNMDSIQMKARCPNSTFKYLALLPKYRLAFTRYSEKRGCGVADVVKDPASPGVWGVVYDVPEEDFAKLDACEGYCGEGLPNAYDKRSVVVFKEGDKHYPEVPAIYIVAKKSIDEHFPSKEYLHHLIAGAKHWGLPEGYVQELQRMPFLA